MFVSIAEPKPDPRVPDPEPKDPAGRLLPLGIPVPKVESPPPNIPLSPLSKTPFLFK